MVPRNCCKALSQHALRRRHRQCAPLSQTRLKAAYGRLSSARVCKHDADFRRRGPVRSALLVCEVHAPPHWRSSSVRLLASARVTHRAKRGVFVCANCHDSSQNVITKWSHLNWTFSENSPARYKYIDNASFQVQVAIHYTCWYKEGPAQTRSRTNSWLCVCVINDSSKSYTVQEQLDYPFRHNLHYPSTPYPRTPLLPHVACFVDPGPLVAHKKSTGLCPQHTAGEALRTRSRR